jgi:hypothetical protein
MYRVIVLAVALSACAKAPPPANPEFSDAVRATFVDFDGPEVDLAFAVRALLDNIDTQMDVHAESPHDRALTPERLTEEDVAALEHPDRDPALALPVAVAGLSAFPPDDQVQAQMLTDLTPIEHYSPNHFERTFLEGEDCWPTRDCDVLKTSNDVTKENALMTIDYVFFKDFRWVDLGLPDPADVPEGEEAVDPGEPIWGFVGRSWQKERFDARNENTSFEQSYTVELWMPNDEGGTTRLLSVWAETVFDDFSFSDDQVAGTTRQGIDENFQDTETWLEENIP